MVARDLAQVLEVIRTEAGMPTTRFCKLIGSEHGLSEGRLAALLAIGADPGITSAQLADRLSVARATITGLVDGHSETG